MAEFSGFWTTGAAVGDQQAGGYTQSHWSTAAAIMSACQFFEGVAPNYANRLACTVGGANTVAVNTGAAVVDGKWYHNTASVNVNIPSAVGVGNTRIDRVVLRCSWAGFTVRITRIAGTDDVAPTPPAITQTSGTTYDILLCQALVDTGGTVTVTDERTIAHQFTRRQGGHVDNFGTAGTTNYTMANAKMVAGSSEWTGGAATSGTLTITLPITFGGTPLVIGSVETAAATQVVGGFAATAADTVVFSWFAADGATTSTSVLCHWLVIGTA